VAYLELHAHTSQQKNSKSFVSNDPDDCYLYYSMPLLDATSFKNGYPTTEELVCSAVSKEIVCHSIVHFAHNFTWNHPAWYYLFMPVTRN
jgi:hypothetical protein